MKQKECWVNVNALNDGEIWDWCREHYGESPAVAFRKYAAEFLEAAPVSGEPLREVVEVYFTALDEHRKVDAATEGPTFAFGDATLKLDRAEHALRKALVK